MIVANKATLTEEWGPNRPFVDLVKRKHRVQEFAHNAGRPISDINGMDDLYTVIFLTRVLTEDCKKWDEKLEVDKTWPNFQTHFTEAQSKVHRHQCQTFELARTQLDQTNEELANIATAAANDKEQMSMLNKTIHEQNETNTMLTTQLADLTNKLTTMTGTATVQKPRRNIMEPAYWKDGNIYDSGGYCWSHGYVVKPDHMQTGWMEAGPQGGSDKNQHHGWKHGDSLATDREQLPNIVIVC